MKQIREWGGELSQEKMFMGKPSEQGCAWGALAEVYQHSCNQGCEEEGSARLLCTSDVCAVDEKEMSPDWFCSLTLRLRTGGPSPKASSQHLPTHFF